MELKDIDSLVAARANFNKLREQTKHIKAARTEQVCAYMPPYPVMLEQIRKLALDFLRKEEELARATLATLGVTTPSE